MRGVLLKTLAREDGQSGIFDKAQIGERTRAENEDASARIVNDTRMHAVCAQTDSRFGDV